ncbi:MAG TPA: phosphate ABC transporter permease PstA [Tepidisphaeraceae bacterium]|jgi:phosphate transport system permease protein|nr:phosphate ABC transporter permease PstA [Tepidisphaeraceae bacterium]
MTNLNIARAKATSRIMYSVCIACAFLIVATLVLITGYLLVIGLHSLNWRFFVNLPQSDQPGMRNSIEGTIILVALASLAGIPIGMLAGVYLSEYEANSILAGPVRFVSDVLAGVPSIVVGILGYELIVVPAGTYSGWAGAAALAFIMIPIVARTTEEMLRLVPASYREASIALGATKARTILRVVIPSATGSLVTGAMLAVARVAGETAPLLFTAVGSPYLVHNPSRPFPSLTLRIYELSNEPSPEARSQAWSGILVLIALIFVVNLSVRYFTRQRK